jgi:hypothetical protein
MEVVDPKAARKQVSPASHSGGNLFLFVPTAEILNELMLLKLLCLNHFIFYVPD